VRLTLFLQNEPNRLFVFMSLIFYRLSLGWLTAGRDGRSGTVDLMHGKCEVLVGERKSASTLEH
jgi:hypothetical protein